MKEVKGKYGTAKIFTDLVEDSAIDQVKTLMNQEFVDGCKVRMMPVLFARHGDCSGVFEMEPNRDYRRYSYFYELGN